MRHVQLLEPRRRDARQGRRLAPKHAQEHKEYCSAVCHVSWGSEGRVVESGVGMLFQTAVVDNEAKVPNREASVRMVFFDQS